MFRTTFQHSFSTKAHVVVQLCTDECHFPFLLCHFPCRNTLNEIYFGKTRDIVNGLRSVQPLSQEKEQDELRKEIASALAKKNAGKADG